MEGITYRLLRSSLPDGVAGEMLDFGWEGDVTVKLIFSDCSVSPKRGESEIEGGFLSFEFEDDPNVSYTYEFSVEQLRLILDVEGELVYVRSKPLSPELANCLPFP